MMPCAAKKMVGSTIPSKAPSVRIHRSGGFEPSADYSQGSQDQLVVDSSQRAHTQIRAQIPDALGRDLSQVVASWSKLPAPLKAAILAIVNSSNLIQEDEL